MKLKIEIELDNDAFAGRGGVAEVYCLLVDLCTRLPLPLKETDGSLTLLDKNGNWVGYGRIDPGEIERES